MEINGSLRNSRERRVKEALRGSEGEEETSYNGKLFGAKMWKKLREMSLRVRVGSVKNESLPYNLSINSILWQLNLNSVLN